MLKLSLLTGWLLYTDTVKKKKKELILIGR